MGQLSDRTGRASNTKSRSVAALTIPLRTDPVVGGRPQGSAQNRGEREGGRGQAGRRSSARSRAGKGEGGYRAFRLTGAADTGDGERRCRERIYESPNGKKYPRVQLLTIEALENTQRAEHPDYEPNLNFKQAKAETEGEQPELI